MIRFSRYLLAGNLTSFLRRASAGRRSIFWLLAMLVFSCIILTDYAAASTTGSTSGGLSNSSDPIGYVLCQIIIMITGTTGKAVSTIALIFLAVGLFVGKVTWGVAIAVGIGIGGLFGATSIVQLISGGSKLVCSSSLS